MAKELKRAEKAKEDIERAEYRPVFSGFSGSNCSRVRRIFGPEWFWECMKPS